MAGILPEYIDEDIIDMLADTVRDKIPMPTSKYAVAIQLEMLGITNSKLLYNFDDVTLYSLSEKIFQRIKEKNKEEHTPQEGEELDSDTLWERLIAFAKYYGAGLLFMSPMFSQILSVVFISYSLWAWLYFNELQATTVAFGTIGAFLITGGLAYYAGRDITFYLHQKQYQLSYKVSRNLLGWGMLFLMGAASLVYLVNVIIPFYPASFMIISGIYVFFIGMWMLSSSVLYAMQKHFMILVGVLGGTLFLIFAMEYLKWGIYLSHWAGMATSSMIMIIFALVDFRYNIIKKDQEKNLTLPNFEITYYNNYRYVIYGACYFLFIFLDRILAWSAGSPPYIIWFDTSYELGMDWALLSLIFITASLEYSINRFSNIILPAQKKVNINKSTEFHNFFLRFYKKQIVLLVIVGAVSIIGSYFAIQSLKPLADDIQIVEDFFASEVLYRVYWIASIGYLFTSFGLLNALFFFTLGRPNKIIKSILIAIGVNLLVGFICSRLYSYEFAVVGLLAGGITFSIITGYYARKLFQNLHYYYYSAY